MSRNRKKNITPFQDYEKVNEDSKYEKDYIRMLDIQLICMNELSPNAFRLYIMMKAYANGNAEFEYPHKIYKTFLSNQTFISARQELLDKGYIRPFISNANLRKANKYRLSSEWRANNKDKINEIITNRKNNKHPPPKQ